MFDDGMKGVKFLWLWAGENLVGIESILRVFVGDKTGVIEVLHGGKMKEIQTRNVSRH